ncbi:MAG: hypothetical protein KDB00_19840 [Planctomycetales bacterium]|nr:hypothetical protein [Planctomycetales bacterium]
MCVKLIRLAAFWLMCCVCAAQTPTSGTNRRETQQTVEGIGRILQVDVGGGGRFLVLRLEDRLAVFDVVRGEIIAHVPLPSSATAYAAGKSVLVLIDPVEKRLQRWTLPDVKKISDSAVDLEMDIGSATLGAASDGPLLLVPNPCRWPLEEVRLVDLATLKPIVDEIELVGRAFNSAGAGHPAFATASDDGTTFYVAPSGLLLRVEPGRVVGRFCTEVDWINTMQPGKTGRYLFGWGLPLDQRNAQTRAETIDQVRTREAGNQITIHDHSGPFYLSMRPVEDGTKLEAFYMTEGELEPLGKVEGVTLEAGKSHLPVAQRVHLHSREGVIVTLDDVAGRINVHRRRPGDILPKNDPRRMELRIPSKLIVYAGQAFAHHLQLAGEEDETIFEVVGGPDGLAVDENGVLRWLPPELGKDMTIDVDLRASLGKNQVVHRLELTIRSSRSGRGAGQTGSMRDSKRAVAKWLIDPPTKGWLASTGLTEPPDETIKVKVATKPSAIRLAAEGRALMFRQPGSISILSTQSGKRIAQLPAHHTGTQFVGGLDCIIVHDPVDQTLTRWRLDDLTVSHQVKVPLEGESRLLLLGAASSGPLLVEAKGSRQWHRFDSQTLESLEMPPVHDPKQQPISRLPLATVSEISEDGTTLLASRYNEVVSLVPTGQDYQAYAKRWSRSLSARMSSDGRSFYSQTGPFDRYWRPQQLRASSGVVFPAVSGPFFCDTRIEKLQVGSNSRPEYEFRFHAQVFHRFLPESISTLSDLPLVEPQRYLSQPNLDLEQIWFIPHINRLVRFDSRTMEFVIHRWDVLSALKNLRSLRPIMISSPQIWIRRGSLWSYQLQSLPRGKVTYRLPVAPDGMELDENGILTWNVPTDLVEQKYRVVVVAESEYGKEENHGFDLLILR